MQNKPETYSEFYIYWLGMNQISLNTEYRICDTLKWKNDIEMSICSFKLN